VTTLIFSLFLSLRTLTDDDVEKRREEVVESRVEFLFGVRARDNGPTFNSHMVIVFSRGKENVNIENNKIFQARNGTQQPCNPYFSLYSTSKMVKSENVRKNWKQKK